MAAVRLEVMAWLGSRLGGPGTGTLVLEAEVQEGEKVQALLHRLAGLYPVFREHIYDPEVQELTSQVTVIYNGRLLELAGGLGTPLQDGDTLLFVPAFAGG